MDLDELRAFLDVVDAGSLLAAADARGVSRTTLKRRIDGLEARAGVPLIQTTSRGIVVTEAGRVLVERGREVSREMGVLVTSLRRSITEPEGVLRVILPVGMPPHVLPLLFAAVRARWPKLRIDVQFSDDPLDQRLEDVDVALHFGEPPRGPWRSFVLLTVRLWLLAHRGYLDRRGTPTSLADLREHDLLAWRAPGGDPSNWPTPEGTTFRVEPNLIGTDIHVIRTCCIARQGIALLPDALIPDPGVDPAALVRVLPDLIGAELPIRMSVPELLADSAKIKVVVDEARRFIATLPPMAR
jgi:DNA-binding transcriptional LysR family regulator